MDHPRPNTRGSIPSIDFENVRRDSDQNSSRIISRSKSPLRSYKENATNVSTQSNLNQTEGFATPFSKSQASQSNNQRSRHPHNITNTEPTNKGYKQNDVPRKLESFKRAGSMQVANINDISKESVYNFIPPQSFQTICNGNNNMTNPLAQSYDKNSSSGTNTLFSGGTSGGASTASYCKNCKRLEDQDKILTYSINQLLNQISDVVDKQKVWRQGHIALDADNFGWNIDDEQSIDPRLLKKSDSGRIFLETKKQFLMLRKAVEDLIGDVESLSKTKVFKDIQLQQKENKSLNTSDLNQSASSSGRKLLTSIGEAKQYLESLRSAVFSEEIPPEIREEIKLKTRKDSDEGQMLKTLLLQLQQSKRERRVLEVELSLQKKGVLQNQNNLNSSALRQMIRQTIDEEIKLA